MAAGLPTVCSDMSSMPELLLDSGIFFDPLSPESIASALETLIKSPKLRSEKAQKSYELAKKFSWNQCADDTFRFFKSCLVK